jgi:hypothetical protein
MMLASAALTQLQAHPAAAELKLYEKSLARIKKAHSDDLGKLGVNYLKPLEDSAKKFQKAGDLDGLLSVNTELEYFRKNAAVPVKDDTKPHAETLRIRALYKTAKNKVDHTKYKSATKLNGNFLYYLKNLQKMLTKNGKLEDAIIIRDEVARITKYQATISSETKEDIVILPPKETNAKKLTKNSLLAWESRRDGTLTVTGGRSFKYKLSHKGGNKLANGALHMTGGKTVIEPEDLNQLLLESCKKTNALSIVAHFETNSLKQEGPARILSFSLNSIKRNFTLGQENDKLMLRLRTTETGENGSNPEVILCKLEEGQQIKVVITYQPDELAVYIDGKSKAVQQIKGDFSNWEACHFVLGNESMDERPWKGRIYEFSVYSTIIPPKEALLLSK